MVRVHEMGRLKALIKWIVFRKAVPARNFRVIGGPLRVDFLDQYRKQYLTM